MTVVNPKSISGINSITTGSGSDNLLTIHTSDASNTERFRIDSTGATKIVTGIVTTLTATTGIVTTLTANTVTSLGAVSGTTGTFTGDVDIADAIVRTGDTNTKIRFPAADTITAETSGSERLRITSNGRIGIFDSDPQVAFHVQGANGAVSPSSYSVLDVAIEDNAEAALGIIGNSFSSIYFGDAATVLNAGIVYNHSDNALQIRGSGNAERLRISSDGKIGIGEATPLAQLHIKPASNISQLLLEQNNATHGYSLHQDGPNGGHLKFLRHIDGSETQTLLLRSDGGLCFGTDSAAANALDDYEEGTWTVGLTFGGGNTGITFEYNTGKYIKIGGIVVARFGIRLSSKGSSTGAARITGLPYNGQHGAYYHDAGALITIDGGANTTGGHTLCFLTDSTKLALRQGYFGNTNYDSTNTMFNNNTALFGTIVYNTIA